MVTAPFKIRFSLGPDNGEEPANVRVDGGALNQHARAGMHGLYRLLRYCRHPSHQNNYDLPGPEDLDWVLGPDHFTLIFHGGEKAWAKARRLSGDVTLHLVQGAFGKMQRGLVVLPGYSNAFQDDVRSYATATAHGGVCNTFRPSKKAGRRLFSLSGKGHGEAYAKHTGASVITAIKPSADSGEMPVNPFSLLWYPKKGEAVAVPDPMKASPGGFQPALQMWEAALPALSQPEAFLLAFCPLAYVYGRTNQAWFGVCMDFASFDEADKYHKRVSLCPDGWCFVPQGAADAAACELLAFLGCPPGTYRIQRRRLDSNGTGEACFVSYTARQQELWGRIVGMAQPASKQNSCLHRLPHLPLRRARTNGRWVVRKSVYDQVYDNSAHNLSLLTGFDALLALDSCEYRQGVNGGQWVPLLQPRRLDDLAKLLETPMEHRVRSEFKEVLRRLAQHFLRNASGGDWNSLSKEGRGRCWKEAKDFVRVRLNRASYGDALRVSLAEIFQKADCGFSVEVQAYLDEHLYSRPDYVRGLLGMALYTTAHVLEDPTEDVVNRIYARLYNKLKAGELPGPSKTPLPVEEDVNEEEDDNLATMDDEENSDD